MKKIIAATFATALLMSAFTSLSVEDGNMKYRAEEIKSTNSLAWWAGEGTQNPWDYDIPDFTA